MSANDTYVMAVAPVSRGFGLFVVTMKGQPIDWRVREIRNADDKNARCQASVDQLIEEFRPVALVIEDHQAPESQRRERVQELLELLASLPDDHNIKLAKFGPARMRAALDLPPRANKHKVAAALTAHFPILASLLPPPKKIWEPEVHSMAIFSAAALAFAYLKQQGVATRKPSRRG